MFEVERQDVLIRGLLTNASPVLQPLINAHCYFQISFAVNPYSNEFTDVGDGKKRLSDAFCVL